MHLNFGKMGEPIDLQLSDAEEDGNVAKQHDQSDWKSDFKYDENFEIADKECDVYIIDAEEVDARKWQGNQNC